MTKLLMMLSESDIPFEIKYWKDSKMFGKNVVQIFYPSIDNRICDVICHKFSFGYDKGLLEIMGLVSKDCYDDVEGYLTAEEVFNRISNHYYNKNK